MHSTPLKRRPGTILAFTAGLLLVGAIIFTLAHPRTTAGDAATYPEGLAPAGVAVESNGWERVFIAPEVIPGVPFHFYGMTFVNEQIGYAYGGAEWDAQPNELPGRVYKTTDGGTSWTLVHQSPGWKIAMACWNAQTCWIGGKSGGFYRTNDGGASWTRVPAYNWDENSGPTPTPVAFQAWPRSAATWAGGGGVILFGATDNVILRSETGDVFYSYWPFLPLTAATWSVDCPTPTWCWGGQTWDRMVLTHRCGAHLGLPPHFAAHLHLSLGLDPYGAGGDPAPLLRRGFRGPIPGLGGGQLWHDLQDAQRWRRCVAGGDQQPT